MRYCLTLVSLFCLVFVTIRCGNLNTQNRVYECGLGFVLTKERGCVPEGVYCNPSCSSDEICREQADGTGRCMQRVELQKNEQPIQCTVACAPGEICKDGKCVSVPCKPACQQGYICSRGICVLREECNPPCPQFGFVCVEGLCEKICVPACTGGKVCVQGICEKECSPACNNGSFCREGRCVKLEDADDDGFPVDRDCDDKDPKANPGVPEFCNGKDMNCDGKVDNVEEKPCYSGASSTLGVGPCQSGVTACKDGKPLCRGEVAPKQEICNRKDDDCSGQVDDNATCPNNGTCKNGKCEGGGPAPEPKPEPAPEKVGEMSGEMPGEGGTTTDAGPKETPPGG